MHIRAYLFLMAAGILIPVILFSGLALNLLQDAERDAALGALVETANSVALRVERDLYSAEASLQVLAASPSLARQDYPAFYNEALVTKRAKTVWTVMLDAQGRQLINTTAPYGELLAAPTDETGLLAHSFGASAFVSDLEPGGPRSKLVTSVNLPVTLDGERRYVLRQTFATEHFNRLLQDAGVPSGWLVALIDGKGNFIARSMNAHKLVGAQARPELVAAARAQRRGQIRHLTLEGAEAYDVFTHCSLSGWVVAVAAPVAQIERSARQASYVAGMGLLAAVACAVGMAALFGRQHVLSIGRAVKAAIELGNGIPPERRESRVLEVNELHGALHAAGEQLRQAQAYRKHAETERQALLESEQAARLMAEQQNRAKDQFLAMLGHELRNPLAPISTAAQLLKLQSGDPSRVRYASDVIARQVEHMNSLLGDMLDVSRVTRGLVSLSLEDVELKGVIERALEQTAGLIEVKRHRLRIDLPPVALHVRADKTRLIQIFANLINNAAKYTPAEGAIGVSASVADGQVAVTVQDNGEGFSADLLPRLFDLFSQGERQPDRSQGGLGLGLALVKSLVQLHGGTVSAASPGPGQGSRFTVILPCSTAPRAADNVAGEAGAAAPLRVMIVDDNIDGAISLSMYLEMAAGHCVETCYDGATALALAGVAAPDVFILDIGLPDMTGYDLARRLKALPHCAGALFIALTGYGQAQDKADARAAGFDHHVPKPADPQAILALLSENRGQTTVSRFPDFPKTVV
jgi:signal transduction histidine kinase/ActR/RegA family two-component response regulator